MTDCTSTPADARHPIDFHAFTDVDLHHDKNLYVDQGLAVGIERPSERNYLGQTLATQRDSNHMELVLGDHGRSGGQYDICQAVYGPQGYGPQGADGYPAPPGAELTSWRY